MPEPHLRASDSDRSAVAAALGEHMAAGRLTLAEYEERLTRVYETKTLGGLTTLTTDLPGTTPAEGPVPAEPAAARAPATGGNTGCGGWSGDAHTWESWRRTAIIVLAIWAATSLATWEFLYFWPGWVIGPWGAVLLAQSLTGGRDEGRDTRRRIRA